MKRRMFGIVAWSTGLMAMGEVPAVAVDPLLFSVDGDNWATDLSDPLFDNSPVLVPGEQVSASFWVRNASPDTADLSVMVESDWPVEGEDQAAFWFHASADGSTVGSEADTGRLGLAVSDMQAGQSRKVTVTVGLHESAENSTQSIIHPVAFDVRLIQSIPVDHPGVGRDQGSSDSPISDSHPDEPKAGPGKPFGSLAETGFATLWMAVIGAVLTAGGALAAVCSRRNRNLKEAGGHGPA